MKRHTSPFFVNTNWMMIQKNLFKKYNVVFFTATDKSLGVSNLTGRARGTRRLFETRSFVL
jgi:hypothetical protein